MQGRLLNGALTAFDRYRVFAQSHQTRGPWQVQPVPSRGITQCRRGLPGLMYVNKQAESQEILNVTPKSWDYD